MKLPIPVEEIAVREDRLKTAMESQGTDTMLITSNRNLFYTLGRVYNGFTYLSLKHETLYFVRRPVGLQYDEIGDRIVFIRKPEQIPEILAERELPLPSTMMLESDIIPANEYFRLQAVFPDTKILDGTGVLREARSVKTPYEMKCIRKSAQIHADIYKTIPEIYHRIYRPGLRDIDMEIEIEHVCRQNGHIGLFPMYGFRMDIFMGNILAGDNANVPATHDFALGGAGLHPALPIGACGDVLKDGTTLMVDAGANYEGYISDISRVFSFGPLPDMAYEAHQVSIDIQNAIMEAYRPDITCGEVYDMAYDMVEKAGLSAYYMGLKQQAKFLGHGVGIEINELPVLMPRSKVALTENMVVAIEPKFCFEGIGAVGTENTFTVTSSGLEQLTVCEDKIIDLHEWR